MSKRSDEGGGRGLRDGMSEVEAWGSRWVRGFHLVFYGGLALSTAIALFDQAQPYGWRVVTAAIAVAMAAWHWFFVYRRIDLHERLGAMAPHLLVLIVFIAVLLSRDLIFTLLLPIMIAQPMIMLPRPWSYGALGLMVVVVQAFSSPSLFTIERIWILPLMIAGTLGIAGLIDHLFTKTERHMIISEDLRKTQALLAEQSHRAGVLEERARLAREIHDTLAQGFTGIITQLEAAEQGGNPAEHVKAAKRLARDSLTEARRSVDALRPSPLDHGLDTALRRVAAGPEIPVTVIVTGEPRPVGAETETALLRAAQEGLANVARHSGASKAAVTLSYMDDEVTLDIVDDGRGFDPAAAVSGYGLAAMRERVSALSGSAVVESAPGSGAAISVTVPA